MKVYLIYCKYYKDWGWEIIKIFKDENKAINYLDELNVFDKYIDEMEIED